MRILERLFAGWQHISQLDRVITNLRYLISHVGDHGEAGVLDANVDLFGQLNSWLNLIADGPTGSAHHHVGFMLEHCSCFKGLTRLSENSHRKLRDIAQSLVDSTHSDQRVTEGVPG